MADMETRTNLSVPVVLYERIMEQAEADRRQYKPEIIVLLEEALAIRERKRQTPPRSG
jgi:hypothetical protein